MYEKCKGNIPELPPAVIDDYGVPIKGSDFRAKTKSVYRHVSRIIVLLEQSRHTEQVLQSITFRPSPLHHAPRRCHLYRNNACLCFGKKQQKYFRQYQRWDQTNKGSRPCVSYNSILRGVLTYISRCRGDSDESCHSTITETDN